MNDNKLKLEITNLRGFVILNVIAFLPLIPVLLYLVKYSSSYPLVEGYISIVVYIIALLKFTNFKEVWGEVWEIGQKESS